VNYESTVLMKLTVKKGLDRFDRLYRPRPCGGGLVFNQKIYKGACGPFLFETKGT
jgi:hypothetical protein